ncbi:MAG: hypothetical protein ABR978_08420 [Dehalococcoidia bacterium]
MRRAVGERDFLLECGELLFERLNPLFKVSLLVAGDPAANV